MAKRSNSKKRLRKRRIEGEELYGEAATLERKQKAISDIGNEELFTVEKVPEKSKVKELDPTKNFLNKGIKKSKQIENQSSSLTPKLVKKYYRQRLERIQRNKAKNQKKKQKTPALLWNGENEEENNSYLPTPKKKKGARKQPKHVKLLKGVTMPHTGQSVQPDSKHHFGAMVEIGKIQARLDKYRNKLETLSRYPQYLDDIIGDEVLDGMKADMNFESDEDSTAEPPEPRDNSYVPVAERRKRMIRKMKERLEEKKAIERKKLEDIDRLYDKVKHRIEKEKRKNKGQNQDNNNNNNNNNNNDNTEAVDVNNANNNNNNNHVNQTSISSQQSKIKNINKNSKKKINNKKKRNTTRDDILSQWAIAAGNRVSKKRRQRSKQRRLIKYNKELDRLVKQASNPIGDFDDIPLKQELSKSFRRAPVQTAASSVLQYQQRKYQAMGIAGSLKGDKRNKMIEKSMQ